MKKYLTKTRKRIIGVVVSVLIIGSVIFAYQNNKSERSNVHPIAPSVENKEDLTPKAIKDSKEVAELFVKNFASMDVNKPMDYLEKSKPYMSPGLYKQFSQQPKRPLVNEVKKEVVKMRTFPVDDISPGRKKWNVIAEVETTLQDHSKHKEEDWYWLFLDKKENGVWKVQGVEVDVNTEE